MAFTGAGNQAYYDDLTSITLQYIEPKINDVYFKVSTIYPLLFREENIVHFSGTSIQVPLSFAPLKGGPTAPGATYDISQAETTTAMNFIPKEYYSSVTLSRRQIALNQGEQAVLSYIQAKMVNLYQSMAQYLAQDVYNDGQGTVSGVNSLDGLLAACDDGTNYPQYGQLARAGIGTGANAGINGYYASVGTPITTGIIQQALGNASFGNVQPNCIFTTQNIWNTLWNRVLPAQRLMDEDPGVASFGVASIKLYGNKRVMVDQYIAPGLMFGVRDEFLRCYVVEDRLYGFGFTGFKELPDSNDGAGQTLFLGNIVYSQPRVSFVLTNISNG